MVKKVKWTSELNGEAALDLGYGISARLCRAGARYAVKVADREVPGVWDEPEPAKRAAEDTLRNILRESLLRLGI